MAHLILKGFTQLIKIPAQLAWPFVQSIVMVFFVPTVTPSAPITKTDCPFTVKV